MAEKTLAQKNREYWNTETRKTFESKEVIDLFQAQWVLELQKQITDFLTSTSGLAWLDISKSTGEPTRMLDYACGNGLLSRILNPHFDVCIGVDISEGMLVKYQDTTRELGLHSKQMFGVRGDFLSDPLQPTEPLLANDQLFNFDLVVCSMALHHVEDATDAIRKLGARLKPGGIMLIVDWAARNGSTPEQRDHDASNPVEPDHGNTSGPALQSYHYHQHHHHNHGDWKAGNSELLPGHKASHTISHECFTESQMRSWFELASCAKGFKWKLADQLSEVPSTRTGKMQLFFARGTKV